MLVTPSDGLVSHAAGWNSSTIGIEVVGQAQHLDRGRTADPQQVTGANLAGVQRAPSATTTSGFAAASQP